MFFGPWELTLGPRRRYQRWGQRTGTGFLKGKILLNLGSGARTSRTFKVDDLLAVIHQSADGLEAVEAVATKLQDIPEVGEP